jgi:iron complex outermembrane receptor protein
MVGVQWESAAFSALGEEALVPSNDTRSRALFVLEQYRQGPLTLAAGLRRESVDVDSAGDAAGATEPRFGAAQQRHFAPRSASLQFGYALTSAWGLQLNLADTQRAPAFYELFADGMHVASGAYERGDAALGLEKARSADLGLQWSEGGSSLKLNVYETRFGSYIALAATGARIDLGSESVPEYVFRSVPARLRGVELEARHTLAQRLAGWRLTLDGRFDAVRGIDRSSGEALPRLAPQRASFAIEADDGRWLLGAELKLAARQTRVPVLDTATPGYGLLKLSLARRLQIGNSDALWYLKLDNLGNTLAYNASSIATVRSLAPQAARSLMTGLQLRF